MENNQLIPIEEKGEIVLYQPDDNVRLEVRLQDDTVWLTQQQMAELFKTTKQNVSLHINNIFREGELMQNSVVKESLTNYKQEAYLGCHHDKPRAYKMSVETVSCDAWLDRLSLSQRR